MEEKKEEIIETKENLEEKKPKTWPPIEGSIKIFNKLLHNLTQTQSFEFLEVFSMDEEFLMSYPKCYGVILCFTLNDNVSIQNY